MVLGLERGWGWGWRGVGDREGLAVDLGLGKGFFVSN